MKTKLLLLCLLTGFQMLGQTIDCYITPDGSDGSGWSYKDYIIPAGSRLDSVLMDATRPGFLPEDFDLVIESCQGTTTYNHPIGTYPIDYSSDMNSEYNVWINLVSFNYVSVGMLRISLPTNAGAIWNQVCFATSPYSTTSIVEEANEEFTVYPNPVNDYIIITNIESPVSIYDIQGQMVTSIEPTDEKIDISNLERGIYVLRIANYKNKIIVKK